jgi:hypothetical protein
MEDPSHSIVDLGNSWLHEAYEKRWLLSQIGLVEESFQLPLGIQKLIVTYAGICDDINKRQKRLWNLHHCWQRHLKRNKATMELRYASFLILLQL